MPDIDTIASRPREYLAETGVPYLAVGLVFFFLGGGVLIQQRLPRGFIQLIPQWLAIFCVVAVLLGTRALKRRIVFPRGGYVEPRQRPANRLMFVASLALVAVGAIIAIFWPGHWPDMESSLTAPGFAIAFAILLVAGGWQRKSAPMIWFGVYFAVLAALLWRMPAGSSYEGLSWLQVLAGAPVAVAGAIRLRRFLRANPRPVETANE